MGFTQSGNAENGQRRMLICPSGNPYVDKNVMREQAMTEAAAGKAVPRVDAKGADLYGPLSRRKPSLG